MLCELWHFAKSDSNWKTALGNCTCHFLLSQLHLAAATVLFTVTYYLLYLVLTLFIASSNAFPAIKLQLVNAFSTFRFTFSPTNSAAPINQYKHSHTHTPKQHTQTHRTHASASRPFSLALPSCKLRPNNPNASTNRQQSR